MTAVCHMGKQSFPELMKNNQGIEIRNEIIKENKCKSWTEFTGIPAISVEQRQSSKWTKWAFWLALATFVAVLATWILSQFILD
jgi:hypothetical protein